MRYPRNSSILDRFEERFIPEPMSGCWLWTSYVSTGDGYAIMSVNRRQWMASHLSWLFYKKTPIPQGMYVCHRCDNPYCVNPDHLFLGTPRENLIDCLMKNRKNIARWNRRPHKLTDADVAAIKADARPQKAIASDFGVCQQLISSIKSGKRRDYSATEARYAKSAAVTIRELSPVER